MEDLYVFYAAKLYGTMNLPELRLLKMQCSNEFYENAYIYATAHHDWRAYIKGWYRMNGTPVLLDDVPTEYQTMMLLLT